jgi:hypothetical protein
MNTYFLLGQNILSGTIRPFCVRWKICLDFGVLDERRRSRNHLQRNIGGKIVRGTTKSVKILGTVCAWLCTSERQIIKHEESARAEGKQATVHETDPTQSHHTNSRFNGRSMKTF